MPTECQVKTAVLYILNRLPLTDNVMINFRNKYLQQLYLLVLNLKLGYIRPFIQIDLIYSLLPKDASFKTFIIYFSSLKVV